MEATRVTMPPVGQGVPPSPSPRPSASPQPSHHTSQRSEDLLDKHMMRIPVQLGEYIEDPHKSTADRGRVELLCEAHPWLLQLQKEVANLEVLRLEFLTDGYTFLFALDEFLDAVKWQEFVLAVVNDSVPGAILIKLVEVFRHEDSRKTAPFLKTVQMHSTRTSPAEGDVVLSESTPELPVASLDAYWVHGWNGEHGELVKIYSRHPRLTRAMRSRLRQSDPFTPSWMTCPRTVVTESLQSQLPMELDSIEHKISQIEQWSSQLPSLHPEKMTFGLFAPTPATEPRPLLVSHSWRRIGRNLRSLSLLVGADMSQPGATIVTSLRNVVNKEGAVVKIMLARIEEQKTTMHKQQQVITALQFRHLLENLPKTLRGRRVTAAGEREAGAKVAEQWDQWSEKERWMQFWEEAVKQVYDDYLRHGSATRLPPGPTPESTLNSTTAKSEKKPSPLAPILERYLGQAQAKGDIATAVKWLARESDIGVRMKDLYSTLSQSIHQFSAGEFKVDPLNFSPQDATLLTALVPLKSKDETIDWKEEFRRYVWGPVLQVQSDEAVIAEVVKLWNAFFEERPRLHHLSATLAAPTASTSTDSTGVTVMSDYTPAESDIAPDGMLDAGLLASLVDLMGRTTVMASRDGAVHAQVEASFKTLAAVKSGDKLQVSGKAVPGSKKQQHSWSVDVQIKREGGSSAVAGGSFKVRKGE